MTPPKKSKSVLRRIFTLQFIRKLILYGFGGLVFVLGVFFLLRFVPEKAFEFSSPYFGTIKTTAVTASNYLAEIETVRRRVEGQRDTIDAAFASAASARSAASNAAEQVVLAQEQLRKMETNAAFLELVARVYSDDRDAFDELIKIYFQAANRAGLATNSQAYRAVGAVNAILDLHNERSPNAAERHFPSGAFLNGKELRESEITLAEVRSMFASLGVGDRLEFLSWFSYSPRFSRLEKLEILLSIRKTDKSLKICEWAAREFCRLSDLRALKPLHVGTLQQMEDWLSTNRLKIKD